MGTCRFRPESSKLLALPTRTASAVVSNPKRNVPKRHCGPDHQPALRGDIRFLPRGTDNRAHGHELQTSGAVPELELGATHPGPVRSPHSRRTHRHPVRVRTTRSRRPGRPARPAAPCRNRVSIWQPARRVGWLRVSLNPTAGHAPDESPGWLGQELAEPR